MQNRRRRSIREKRALFTQLTRRSGQTQEMEMAPSRRIIVTCNNRLAPFLQKEIESLSYQAVRVFQTGVELSGTIRDCIRLNLHLRCASQVLFSIKEFTCLDPEQLYAHVLQIPWERFLFADGYFSVTNNVQNPSVNNELFVNVRIKDAIADRMRNRVGRRPDSGPELNRAVIHLYWKDRNAELFFDTSGETLAKHGYRKIPGRAPMLEALASASLLATAWDQRSAFVNPMCGSGTVAIEAAMLATHRKPGLLRKNYSFMHFMDYEKDYYENELNGLKLEVKEVEGLRILVSDIKKDAVEITRLNAEAAGVEKYMHYEVCSFEQATIPVTERGVIYFNPEYGERMGDAAELENTYAAIGDFMKKKCQGYLGYIFTGNLDLAKKVGLKASRRIEFFSAKLDCRLLEYELYAGSKRT